MTGSAIKYLNNSKSDEIPFIKLFLIKAHQEKCNTILLKSLLLYKQNKIFCCKNSKVWLSSRENRAKGWNFHRQTHCENKTSPVSVWFVVVVIVRLGNAGFLQEFYDVICVYIQYTLSIKTPWSGDK